MRGPAQLHCRGHFCSDQAVILRPPICSSQSAEEATDPVTQLQLGPWLKFRTELPIGALFCVVSGFAAGRPWSAAAARTQFRRLARRAGVRRRFAPHQLHHAHAVEMAREGVPLNVIQRQLGHADLGITTVYLQGIDSGEIVDVVHRRRAPGDTGGRYAGSVEDAPATLPLDHPFHAGGRASPAETVTAPFRPKRASLAHQPGCSQPHANAGSASVETRRVERVGGVENPEGFAHL